METFKQGMNDDFISIHRFAKTNGEIRMVIIFNTVCTYLKLKTSPFPWL